MMYKNYNPVVSNNDDKYYSYECAFDFEAMLKTIKLKMNKRNYTLYQSMFQSVFLYFLMFQIMIINQYFNAIINLIN